MTVTSPAYAEGERIPEEFTCDGAGVNPSYTVSDLPAGTMSIAILMVTTVDGVEITHWVQFDMPPESLIPEDAADLGTLGSGFFDLLGYIAPCPPQGNIVPSDYSLQIFAVDSVLGLNEAASKQKLLEALEGRVLGLGELTGRYVRL